MTDRELMQQALEALESSRVFVTTREKIRHPVGTEWYDERITALRERLAQPEQEPVRVMGFNCVCGRRMEVSAEQGVVPTPPRREWVGLTDEEMAELWENRGWYVTIFKAVEAKLKEKNT